MANILVVDDVADVRKSIKRRLEKENHHVFEAENGITGLRLLREMDIDLLILDIFMPEKGGIDTLMEIKNIPIKKIIITGAQLTESDAFFSLITHYGANKVLFKPFKNKLLIDTVNEILLS